MRSYGSSSSIGCLEGFLTAVAQYFHQSGDKLLKGLVLSCLADGEMELRIGFHSGLAAIDRFPLFFQNPFHPLDVFLCRPLSCQCRDVRLDKLTQLENVGESSLSLNQKLGQRRNQ